MLLEREGHTHTHIVPEFERQRQEDSEARLRDEINKIEKI